MKKPLVGLLILVLFQWLGEWGVKVLGLNIPGQLLGMILLLILLSLNKSLLPWLETTSSQLIRFIALLFVPITTGAFFLGPVVFEQLPQILAVLIISTLLAQWFMALIINKLRSWNERDT
ncbi:holin-like protein [Gammaproteobacteria bacterium MOLA455]|nr:holin-like protein [Gammaproteobacteria bacterium MOLA455]